MGVMANGRCINRDTGATFAASVRPVTANAISRVAATQLQIRPTGLELAIIMILSCKSCLGPKAPTSPGNGHGETSWPAIFRIVTP